MYKVATSCTNRMHWKGSNYVTMSDVFFAHISAPDSAFFSTDANVNSHILRVDSIRAKKLCGDIRAPCRQAQSPAPPTCKKRHHKSPEAIAQKAELLLCQAFCLALALCVEACRMDSPLMSIEWCRLTLKTGLFHYVGFSWILLASIRQFRNPCLLSFAPHMLLLHKAECFKGKARDLDPARSRKCFSPTALLWTPHQPSVFILFHSVGFYWHLSANSRTLAWVVLLCQAFCWAFALRVEAWRMDSPLLSIECCCVTLKKWWGHVWCISFHWTLKVSVGLISRSNMF